MARVRSLRGAASLARHFVDALPPANASRTSLVASASTIERAFPFAESDASASATTREMRSRSDKRAAAAVGDALARRAKAANVDAVKWTRPYGKRFHGKIASLMEALKSGGVGLL